MLARAPLASVWPALRSFLEEWLLQPGDGPRVQALLDERLAGIASDAACGVLGGDEALQLIEDVVRAIRMPVARFGEPAVYVGHVHEAAGLSFQAVRVVGLAEGHVPPLPHEDPVLPDDARAQLAGPGCGGRSIAPPSAADRALGALHALDMAIRTAESRVVLSAPRLDLDRSLREPAAVILEAAAALGPSQPGYRGDRLRDPGQRGPAARCVPARAPGEPRASHCAADRRDGVARRGGGPARDDPAALARPAGARAGPRGRPG